MLEGLTGEVRAKKLEALKRSPKAGLLAILRQAFRRTAVRILVNTGVPERVAMSITGHKTWAVFDRYHIVSPADLQEATRKLAGTFWARSGNSPLDGHGESGVPCAEISGG